MGITRSDINNDLGFGTKITASGERLINKDGSFNVMRRGRRSFALYQWLVEMPWWRFLLTVVVFFVLINGLFAWLFAIQGNGAISGVDDGDVWRRFTHAFFLSTQTFTTVGYGAISPKTPAANLIAAADALAGLLSFSLVTGLLFARFSRPKAQIIFSEQAIIAPYRDMTSLQFRMANLRNNRIINLEATLTMSWLENDGREKRRRFMPLPLERERVVLLPLNWTIVHPINEESPLWRKSARDVAEMEVEFLILIAGYDETFAQQVHANTSYTFRELVWNVKFAPMFYNDGARVVLELDKISDTVTG